jgi:hypothetical protein
MPYDLARPHRRTRPDSTRPRRSVGRHLGLNPCHVRVSPVIWCGLPRALYPAADESAIVTDLEIRTRPVTALRWADVLQITRWRKTHRRSPNRLSTWMPIWLRLEVRQPIGRGRLRLRMVRPIASVSRLIGVLTPRPQSSSSGHRTNDLARSPLVLANSALESCHRSHAQMRMTTYSPERGICTCASGP